MRVAEKSAGEWRTHQWIKKAVLLSFRLQDNQLMPGVATQYYDKVPTKFGDYSEADFAAGGFRVVPPAVARRGAFIAKNVVLMPSYVNIGAYVDEGTMVDTWATVGSCAQIGKNVHLSGGVGIGGVLEPLQANPTIVEDNCFIGARSELVEGVIVEENSVLSMGVFIGASTRIYHRATGEILYGRVPAGSVVVPGSLPGPDGRYSALLRRDRQAGGRSDARKNQHQRAAPRRLNDRGAESPETDSMAIKRLLELMAEKKASDLFISVGAPINIKINGVTMPINQQNVTRDAIKPLIAEILTHAQLEQFEREFELNTSYPVHGLGSFRVSCFMQRMTPGMVIRFIPVDIPKFDTLGLPPVLKELVLEKRGLILMVGATGSGKSTSLAAMIDHRNTTQSGHIITIEDPIEFLFKHKRSIVNQREVGTDAQVVSRRAEERAAAGARRHSDRRGPRPRNDDDGASPYAQSGHLCLATLHANNSYHALNRIIGFYPLENRPALLQDLSATLRVIISQRLVKNTAGAAWAGGRGDAQYPPYRGTDRAGSGRTRSRKRSIRAFRPGRRHSSRRCSPCSGKA